MNLNINGEVKALEQFNENVFLEVLLEHLGYRPQLVVVELNGVIINPKEWIRKRIKDGDCLEVVTIVGGGSYS